MGKSIIKKSFSLIEVIIVITIISIVLPVLFNTLFSVLQQQLKIYRLAEIKRQGDYVLNVMENNIRNNAVSIHSGVPTTDSNEICKNTTSYSNLYFEDKNSLWFHYELSTIYLVSKTSTSTTNLTSNKVRVEGLTITCNRSAKYSPPFIDISYTICYNNNNSPCNDTAIRTEERASMIYKTKIKLRNY